MDGVVLIGKFSQLDPRQFQTISLCYSVTFSYMEISKIYTKEGSVDLMEIDKGVWIKCAAILRRMDYVNEDG